MGSTGQLHTERSLALPESSTPSPMLISLPLHPYWELQDAKGLFTLFNHFKLKLVAILSNS